VRRIAKSRSAKARLSIVVISLFTAVIYPFAAIPHIMFDMTTCSNFGVAIALCLLLPLGAMAQKPEAASVSEAEYEVFSAYINHSFVGDIGRNRVGKPISQIVIVNRTESDKDYFDRLEPDDMPPGGIEKYLQKEAPSLRAITVSNFHRANERQAELALRFRLLLPYQLVSAEMIGSILVNVGDWPKYYAKYPGAQGHMSLSRVGFGADGTQAFFYVGNWCGGLCASGSYVVMEKRSATWKVVKEVFIWMS